MWHHTESMIMMMEDMKRQASMMEKEVKVMLEMEGRACGLELDRRKNARDLMTELVEHQRDVPDLPTMTWAYVPDENAEYDTTMPDDYHPPHSLYADDMPLNLPTDLEDIGLKTSIGELDAHWHDDGTVHSHPEGQMPHEH